MLFESVHAGLTIKGLTDMQLSVSPVVLIKRWSGRGLNPYCKGGNPYFLPLNRPNLFQRTENGESPVFSRAKLLSLVT